MMISDSRGFEAGRGHEVSEDESSHCSASASASASVL